MKYVYIAKSIIKNADGMYLVLRRSQSDPQSPGRVDLPGGGIEDGEKASETAIREALEEANLVIDNPSLQLRYSFTMQENESIIIRYLYFVKIENQQVVLSHEHDSFLWLDKDTFMRQLSETSWGVGIKILDQYNAL